MSEETIGTARIDIVVNTDQFNTAVTRAKTLTSQMGESGEAAYQKLNRGAKAATTNLLKWAEGLGRTAEEQKLLNAAVRGVPVEALEAARKAILGQREAAQAAKQAALDQAAAQKAAAQLQAEAAAESQRRMEQEASARQKLVAQNLAAFRTEQANQQRLAQMRSDALHAFGPELAARERETAEIQRSNAVRERLAAFLATERGQRIQEAEAIRKQSAAYSGMAVAQARAFGGTAKSAKELQFAMRGLPAQISDITVSLASGQRPLMVLLQQGSQLKDMFGGIGPAAKALGSSLLGLINPFTVSAAAATALLVAWKQGSDEAVAYNKALISTGNYAGETASHLGELARSISQSTDATQHAVADTLAQVAASGKFTGQQLDSVGRAAVAMSTLTGQAREETVRQFEEIGKKPVEAILKLNDAQHFLTQETYAQIKALDDQGRSQEAAALAMKTYSDSLQDRAKEVVDNAGTMERAWHAVATEANKAWDAMLDVGRPESDDDKLGRLQREANAAAIALQNLQKNGPQGGGFGLNLEGKYYYNSQLKQAQERAAATLKAYRDEEKRQEAEQQKARADALKARLTQDRADSDREAQGYYTNAQKRAQEYLKAENEFNERIARAMKAGDSKLAERERQQKASVLAGINAKYADKSRPGVMDSSIGNDPRADLTASIGKEISAYKSEADQWARSTSAAVAYRQTLADMLDTRQRAIDLQVASIGMGKREADQQQALIAIDEDYNRKKADLQKRQQDTTSALEREGYQQQLDDLEKYHTQRIQIELDGFKRAEEARKNAALGARAAIKDFEDAAGNVAGQTYDVFSNAFDGLGDALAKFVTTGKLDFSDLTNSVIADLAKMEARILVSQALQSIFGGYGGTNGQGGVTYNDQGFVNHVYAKGGVVDGSRNLSAYSGSVVDRPTLFAFAKGNGLMGEAGPEAIMPLRRGPDGKLGVAAAGAGGGDVQVEVNITNNGQPVQAQQTGTRRDGQKVIVDMVLDAVASDIATGGRTSKAMQQRYGLQRRGVPVGG